MRLKALTISSLLLVEGMLEGFALCLLQQKIPEGDSPVGPGGRVLPILGVFLVWSRH